MKKGRVGRPLIGTWLSSTEVDSCVAFSFDCLFLMAFQLRWPAGELKEANLLFYFI